MREAAELGRFALLSVLLFAPVVTLALDATHSISQYGHTTWTLQEGALPGVPSDMAQTTDGYLWVGTRAGLVRFDGVRFVPFAPPKGEEPLTSRVLSLRAAHDGSLWIGTRTDLEHWQNGHLSHYPDALGTVMSILEDPGGKVWFTRIRLHEREGPLCEVAGAKSVCHGVQDGISIRQAHQLTRDAQGNLWTFSASELLRWKPGSVRTYVAAELGGKGEAEDSFEVFQTLAAAPDGSMWVGATQPSHGLGLLRVVNDSLESVVTPELDGRKLSVSALLLDQRNALWIGTPGEGLLRLHDGKVSRYGTREGLSSDTIQGLFEDREGTLWVLTAQGIDAFRDLRVSSVTSREGLSADVANAVLATRDGAVWINSWHSLDVLHDGKVTSLSAHKGLPGEEVTALFEDRTGTLWLGIDNDLMAFEGGTFKTVKRPDGRSIGYIQQLTQDTAGDIWLIESKTSQMLRIHDRQVVETIPRSEIAFAYAQSMVPDQHEGVWFPLTNGDLAHYRRGQLETVEFHRAPHTGLVSGLISTPDGSIIGGTSLGLIGWRNGRSQTMTAANDLPCQDIHTLLRDRHDNLWLYAACGVIFMASDQVQAWWRDPGARLRFRVFDVLDGARPALGAFFPRSSVGPDGRLWFVNGSMAQVIEPDRLVANTLAPPVHIEGLVADRRAFSPQAGLRLAPHTRDLEIDYTALSLVVPRKNNFRYKLVGHDTDWQDAGARRQAFYTDLRPGDYRFQVIASNNNGVWNESGASLDFAITPALYQTTWFTALCICAGAGALWLLYLVRVRQIEMRIRMRLEERVIERERMTRDLHDTLLQSMQGLILRFQAVLARIPEGGERAMQMMEQALERADQVLAEGREHVYGLRRSTHASNDLPQALQALAKELAETADHTKFRIIIEGAPRRLHPVVREEAYRIGAEALANAARHAVATHVDTEIAYSRKGLTLRVVDDGRGFDAAVLSEGAPRGHFGLSGMRERARRIRARFEVSTRPGSGSAVEVQVPASIAYEVLEAVGGAGGVRLALSARGRVDLEGLSEQTAVAANGRHGAIAGKWREAHYRGKGE
ncbi:MAG: two-component regulator propeller domain-containing protein [Steroidobacteraceae bacterium]